MQVDQVMKLDVVGCEDASDEQTLSTICYSGQGCSNSANPNRKQRKDLVILCVLLNDLSKVQGTIPKAQ